PLGLPPGGLPELHRLSGELRSRGVAAPPLPHYPQGGPQGAYPARALDAGFGARGRGGEVARWLRGPPSQDPHHPGPSDSSSTTADLPNVETPRGGGN